MNALKTLLIAAALACLPITAAANSVDYANSSGTVTAINGGTAISLTGSILTTVTGGVCSPMCTGNLGTVTFTSGMLTSGSLAAGGSFGAGGSITITGNGMNGVPSGTLFQGTFTSATWTVTALPGGNNVFSFSGTLQGTGSFSGPAFTIQGSKIVHGNPFASGGSGSVRWASGDTTVGAVPEPGSLALMGTGILGIGGVVRRKLFS
jgi:PEP-CTERM motif-containing protein